MKPGKSVTFVMILITNVMEITVYRNGRHRHGAYFRSRLRAARF